VDVVVGGRSAVKRSFVRNRGLLFFVPGIILLAAGILLIVSSLSNTLQDFALTEGITFDK